MQNLLGSLIKCQETAITTEHHLEVSEIQSLKLFRAVKHVMDARKGVHDLRRCYSLGPAEVVKVDAWNDALLCKVRQILLSHIGCEEWEERIGTIRRVVPREMTHEKPRKCSTEGTVVRIACAVLEAPSSEIGSCVLA